VLTTPNARVDASQARVEASPARVDASWGTAPGVVGALPVILHDMGLLLMIPEAAAQAWQGEPDIAKQPSRIVTWYEAAAARMTACPGTAQPCGVLAEASPMLACAGARVANVTACGGTVCFGPWSSGLVLTIPPPGVLRARHGEAGNGTLPPLSPCTAMVMGRAETVWVDASPPSGEPGAVLPPDGVLVEASAVEATDDALMRRPCIVATGGGPVLMMPILGPVRAQQGVPGAFP